jgi:N6-adenosine-specific RNA methylase IME4
MSVFEARDYYKPFKYPWAFEAYDMQQKMHWLPSEVPLHEAQGMNNLFVTWLCSQHLAKACNCLQVSSCC